jgi:hypothetical protein
MIEELANGMSELDNKGLNDNHVPENTFATARYVIGCPKTISGSKWMGGLEKTYVYRGSTKVILWISTRRMCCLR